MPSAVFEPYAVARYSPVDIQAQTTTHAWDIERVSRHGPPYGVVSVTHHIADVEEGGQLSLQARAAVSVKSRVWVIIFSEFVFSLCIGVLEVEILETSTGFGGSNKG
jgi:hypothetical protein